MIYPDFGHKLRSGQPVIGTFVKVAAPEIIEQLGLLGFDFVILDMEHGPLTIAQVAELVRAADTVKLPTLVRVAENRQALIQKVLDVGASGVQIPNIESAEQLADAVEAAKYYPKGTRGVSFSHRAARYGFVGKSDYISSVNRDALIIAQVETAKGLEALPEMLKVDDIDCFFFGPADLSQSLGFPGEVEHPVVRAALDRAFARTREFGRIAGTFVGSAEEGLGMVKKGVHYVAVASEQGFLTKGAVPELKRWREMEKG